MELPQELIEMIPVAPDIVEMEAETMIPVSSKPMLRVEKDKRKGKTATLITGYEDDCEEVRELAKSLKQRLAVGGSSRDGEILLQGDVREKVSVELRRLGYKVKTV